MQKNTQDVSDQEFIDWFQSLTPWQKIYLSYRVVTYDARQYLKRLLKAK